MRVPNAERAIVSSEKLTGYLLNLSHKRGSAKARLVFRPGRRVLVLGGYLKKRQDIPSAVLTRVRAYKRDAEERKV